MMYKAQNSLNVKESLFLALKLIIGLAPLSLPAGATKLDIQIPLHSGASLKFQ